MFNQTCGMLADNKFSCYRYASNFFQNMASANAVV